MSWPVFRPHDFLQNWRDIYFKRASLLKTDNAMKPNDTLMKLRDDWKWSDKEVKRKKLHFAKMEGEKYI